MQENVILVNPKDEEIGIMEKLEAHRKGLLHRAFSVFIFNSRGEFLLQKRAESKYHSPGLWTNTCCSHPKPGEDILKAANRRLWEEMGLKTNLEHKFSFVYKTTFENGLTEHEFDHVFFGYTEVTPQPNVTEVGDWRFCSANNLKIELQESPSGFTEWFKICFERVLVHLGNQSFK
ncbi:MAG: isopentenyl-diphosphate Delta-isomerase [Cytophagaceae bacterium]